MKLTGFLTTGTLIGTLFVTGCTTVNTGVEAGNVASGAKNIGGTVTAKSGIATVIDYSVAINEDCTTLPTSISVKYLPNNGTVNIYPSRFPVVIPKDSTKYHCKGRKFYGAVATYTSKPGYTGSDQVRMVNIGYNGFTQNVTTNIRVVK